MREIAKLAAFAAVTLVPATGFAGKGGVSATAIVDLAPVGDLRQEIEGLDDESEPTVLAYGFGAQVDYWVTDQISVGLAPRYLLNINTELGEDNDRDPLTQLDLAVRAQYNHAISPQLSAFGFLAPGYSILVLPDDVDDADNPAGLVFGFGAGGRYGINEKLFAQGELGYQLGFHSTTISNGTDSIDVTLATNLLHIGVGVGSHF